MKRVLLMVLAFGALASYAFAPRVPAHAFQYSVYSDCGGLGSLTPTQACQLYHPYAPGLLGTAYCLGDDCFYMSYGERIRVVAADELGDFPQTWFVWTRAGEDLVNTGGSEECLLSGNANNTWDHNRINIPPENTRHRCKAELETGGYLYHEHFASNPTTRCLGWLECREDIITP